jgi:hypothetical protein
MSAQDYVNQIRRNAAIRAKLSSKADDHSRIANEQLVARGEITRIIDARFRTAGMSMGTVWAPLRPATIKQRLAQGYLPGPPLTRSGTLRTAMSRGRANTSSTRIVVVMRDGPAPRYKGKASAAMLSTYASALDSARPFSTSPSSGSPEMQSFMERRKMVLERLVARVADGK